jgi:hypothetical protein
LPVGSAAGDAARAPFDSGRGEAEFTAWLYAGVGEPLPVRGEPLPAHVRDARIVELRHEGWTLADIGAAVHMSEGGVSRALQRLDRDGGIRGVVNAIPNPGMQQQHPIDFLIIEEATAMWGFTG